MTAASVYHDQEIVLTTDHAASSYGVPVMLVDGCIVDGREAEAIALVLMVHDGDREVRNLARLLLNALPPVPAGTVGAFGVDRSGERHSFDQESEI